VGNITAEEGQTFEAGRMGSYTIEKDPTRDAGLRVLMGPFTVYDAANVEAAAGGEVVAPLESEGEGESSSEGGVIVAEPGHGAERHLPAQVPGHPGV
jgi:hypothetical protein